ncbi:MAG: PQQ-dependent sugar dehydrogenase [Bacteroidia bacterium]|nr:PQQ-dependent sugar dehydrogenase [Bacteroidia bacterium]
MGSLHSITSKISVRIILISLGVIFLAAVIPSRILVNGLNSPAPVGDFVNGVFPSSTPGVGTGSWTLVDAFPNLGFTLPVHMIPEPGGNRLMVGEMRGKIVAFDNNASTNTINTYLDITSLTRYGGESGLLSFAFHPRYGIDSNYVYVFYSWEASGGTRYYRVSRFDGTPGGTANISSEVILIQQQDRAFNHQGGYVYFGTDDYLYVSIGDEGGSSNSYGNAQNTDLRLYSGILRIDVDRNPVNSHPIRRQPVLHNGADQSFTANYYIPNDNPFLDPSGNILEEFYAIGLRNPYRMMTDPITDITYIGDVGQGIREEVDVLVKGANYQWPYREGDHNGTVTIPSPLTGIDTPPLYAYSHSNSDKCIIGGGIYRGSSHPSLYGKYIFADNVSRRFWSMDISNPLSPTVNLLFQSNTIGSGKTGISSFAVDASGEMYVLIMADNNPTGKVMKLATASAGPPDPPALLSQLNLFSNLSTMQPESYTIPYELNVPFWSDNAIKTRYMIIPNDGTHNTAGEQISFTPEGEWELPEGSISIKHFEYAIDESNPSLTQKIETRIIVYGAGSEFYGLSYRWNAAQTDAELLTTSFTDTIEIATPNGPRQVEWYYPSRAECNSCHTALTKGVLGPETPQLNKSITYPQTGVNANQLKTLAFLNIFDVAPDTNNLSNNLRMPPIDDNTASLDERVLGYLNSNCGYCHRPGTGVLADFDARYSISNFKSSIIHKQAINSLGLPGGRLILPGDTNNSVLFERLRAVHEGYAMPPLAKNLMDSAGVDLVKQWIMSLDISKGSACDAGDFSSSTLLTYGGTEDQGQGYIQNAGSRILVENNGWKKISYPYTLTANSVLEFDFASSLQGEEHSIGMDNDDVPDNNRFKLYGTQGTTANTTYNNYSGGGAYQHYVIPIGQHFTGTFSHLIFTADNDANPTSVNSFFQNIIIHEGDCDLKNYQKIDFPSIADQDTSMTSIALGASASSGLPISYQVISGPATVAGNILTFTGDPGYVIVEASQAGDGQYEEAPSMRQQFFVRPNGKASGDGLKAVYYNNADLTDSSMTQVDSEIDFFWSNQRPEPQIEYSTFSAKWEGWLEPPFDGNYQLEITADDGVRVWVDNVLVIDEWRDQAASSYNTIVNLTAWDKVPIRVDYYQNKVFAQARLSWSHSNFSKEVIPTRFLYSTLSLTLPVASLNLTAEKEGKHINLLWETREEKNVGQFILQRSTDGLNFQSINTQDSKGNSNYASYTFTDLYPSPGEYLYKVKMIDIDGTVSYSNVASVLIANRLDELRLRIFPNPSSLDQSRYLEIESSAFQQTRIEIWSLDGRLINEYKQSIEAGIKIYPLEMGQAGLSSGMYLVKIINPESLEEDYQKIWIK